MPGNCTIGWWVYAQHIILGASGSHKPLYNCGFLTFPYSRLTWGCALAFGLHTANKFFSMWAAPIESLVVWFDHKVISENQCFMRVVLCYVRADSMLLLAFFVFFTSNNLRISRKHNNNHTYILLDSQGIVFQCLCLFNCS